MVTKFKVRNVNGYKEINVLKLFEEGVLTVNKKISGDMGP